MQFLSFTGTVMSIENVRENNSCGSGFIKLFAINGIDKGQANFIITQETYFVDNAQINIGDIITLYYDAKAPAILIYPPQYNALIVVLESEKKFVQVSYFNNRLVNSDNSLKLIISPHTEITTRNNQYFLGELGKHTLIVTYTSTTRSIPAQTVPSKIIVWC